jgi:hypothetical protein
VTSSSTASPPTSLMRVILHSTRKISRLDIDLSKRRTVSGVEDCGSSSRTQGTMVHLRVGVHAACTVAGGGGRDVDLAILCFLLNERKCFVRVKFVVEIRRFLLS